MRKKLFTYLLALMTSTGLFASREIVPTDAVILSNHEMYKWSMAENTPTIDPSPYVPTNLQATPNGDGTYTITWEMENTEDIGEYRVEIFYANGEYFDGRYVYSSNSFKTKMVTSTGEYSYRITVYDQNYNSIGSASSTFTVTPTEPRDITVRVLVQPNSNYYTTYGVIFASYDEETANFVPVMANSEGNGWYNYTFSVTDPVLQFTLMKQDFTYYDVRIVTKDTCFEVDVNNFFHPVNCDAVAYDYTPFNLQALPGDGLVKLTWETLDAGYSYLATLYDAQGNTIMSKRTSNTHEITLYLSNAAAMTVASWSVCPNNITNATAYGEAFTVNPSPYIPQNLNAVSNGDGTYTITWDAVNREEVNSYYVNIFGASGSHYDGRYNPATSYITPVLPLAEKYTYTVYAADSIQMQDLGYASSTITVSPIESHDITVRVLVQPYTEIAAENIYFGTSGNERVTPNNEGNGWYNYTFTTTDPGINFYFNDLYNHTTSCIVYNDTCLTYNGRTLQGVECDSVAKTEYDITMTFLDAQTPLLVSSAELIVYNLSSRNGSSFSFVFNLPEGDSDIQLGKEYTYTDIIDYYYNSGHYVEDENGYRSYIYYDSVSFVKTIDMDSMLHINAVVISENGVIYRLHYTHDLHYLINDEAEEDFIAEFAEYNIEKYYEDTLNDLLITAINYADDYNPCSEVFGVILIVPDGVNDLPVGTYPIDHSMDDYTVMASKLIGTHIRGSAAYKQYNNLTQSTQSSWLMVSGTVTIDANKNIVVDAVNSYGRIIRANLKNPEATGFDFIQKDHSYPAQKVLRDGQIFILRGEKVYTLTGHEVR